MKIKFLKPFRLYNPIGDDITMDEGAIGNMEKEDYAQWLIDNGFAEEVKEPGGWKPEDDEDYFYIGHDGLVYLELGLVFKTKEAAMRCRDYWEAIATVRQDEGVLTPEQIIELEENNGQAYHVGNIGARNSEEVLCGCTMDFSNIWAPVGVILFDTKEHANASYKKHQDEWKIILNYDWSRE